MKYNLSLFAEEEPVVASPPEPIVLRDYQEDAVQAVLDGYGRGCMQQIVSMATGLGKTKMCAGLISRLVSSDPNRTQVIWLAHREELLDQAAGAIKQMNPGLSVEIEQASRRASPQADIVIVSVQTLGREGTERINRFDPGTVKLVVADECLAGDTIITTERGTTTIKECVNNRDRFVLTYDGNRIIFKKILNHLSQGEKEVLEITTNEGNVISCTNSHPIFTLRGWVNAGDLLCSDQILSFASVDVVYCSNQIAPEECPPGSTDTLNNSTKEPQDNGQKNTLSFNKMPPSAPVDVETGFCPESKASKNSSNTKEQGSIQNTLKTMKKCHLPIGLLFFQGKKEKPYSEHFLEIPILDTPTTEAQPQEYVLCRALSKKIGLFTKPAGFPPSNSILSNKKTGGLEILSSGEQRNASPVLENYLILLDRSQEAILSRSATWGLRGGLEMMGQPLGSSDNALDYTQTLSAKRSIRSWKHGSTHSFQTKVVKPGPLENQTGGVSTIYHSPSPPVSISTIEYKDTSQNVCSIKFVPLKSIIIQRTNEEVYDIEVEDTHCFWANGLLVHNCHRSLSQGFLNVFEYFDCLREDSEILLLGLTATPKRGDKLGLGNVYREIVYHKGILDAIKDEWLCDIDAHLIQTTTNLDNVATRAGDFAEDQLSDAINNQERNAAILAGWQQFAEGSRSSTLVFCASVEHAKDVADVFISAGIDARCLHGGTPRDERRRTVQEFKEGKFPVLTNCALFVEGTDICRVDAIIWAKPTKSQVTYVQGIGRGLRNSPETGKDNLLLLDVVDVARKHSLVTLPTLFGLPFNFENDSPERSFKKAFEQIENMMEANPRVANATSLSEAVKIISEKIDVLRIGEIPELQKSSNLNWYKIGPNRLNLRVPEEGHLEIEQDFLGKYEASMINLKGDKRHHIGSFSSLTDAIHSADHYVRSNLSKAVALLSTSMSWHKQPASDKQKNFMERLGMRAGRDFKPGITKGEANHLITIKQEQLSTWRQRANFRSRLKAHDVKVGKL